MCICVFIYTSLFSYLLPPSFYCYYYCRTGSASRRLALERTLAWRSSSTSSAATPASPRRCADTETVCVTTIIAATTVIAVINTSVTSTAATADTDTAVIVMIANVLLDPVVVIPNNSFLGCFCFMLHFH